MDDFDDLATDAEATEQIILAAIARGDIPPSDLEAFYQTRAGAWLILARRAGALAATIREALPRWLRWLVPE